MLITKLILMFAALVLLNSCASTQAGKSPEQTLNIAMTGRDSTTTVTQAPIRDHSSDLPYVPVMLPAQVERVWIYDHVTPSGDMVTGHWVFIVLREQKWHIEQDHRQIFRNNNLRVPTPPPAVR